MPLPLLLTGLTAARGAVGLAAGAEAARTATSKLAMFAREMDESTKTLARLATSHGASPVPGAPGQPASPAVEVKNGETEPAVEHPALVWKHRSTPEWFVRKIVKVRFEVPGGTEYLWVQVLARAPRRRVVLVGRLANAPELMEGQLGDVVSFPLTSVIDVQAETKKRRSSSAKRRR
jgi:hypothetical protein